MAPLRTCVGCRERAGQAELVRLAWDPDSNRVEFDPGRRLSGRGAWLHPGGDCLALALTRRALPRALRRPLEPEALASLAN